MEIGVVRVVRYWHHWTAPDGSIAERDHGVKVIVDGLRQRAVPYEQLAPLRNERSLRVCVFGANEDDRTQLIVEALRRKSVTAVFVGRIAAYQFETLLQVSLRTALHFPVCIADLSSGAGTPVEIQALVGSGKIVAALCPRGRVSTQFCRDFEVYGRNFRLFAYDWPDHPATAPEKVHVQSFVDALEQAFQWAEVEVTRTTADLMAAFPWREYEGLKPPDAIRFDGQCKCYT